MNDGERKLQVRVCNCQLITLGGPCSIEGETEMELSNWGAKGENVTVHVMGKMPRDYQIIIGCDLLEKVGAKIKNSGGHWDIRIGGKTYSCQKLVDDSKARVGVINKRENWKEAILNKYDDIFYKEGEVLGATGRTVHEITLSSQLVEDFLPSDDDSFNFPTHCNSL